MSDKLISLKDFDESEMQLGVFLQRTGQNSFHTGVFCKYDKEVRIVELAFDHLLQDTRGDILNDKERYTIKNDIPLAIQLDLNGAFRYAVKEFKNDIPYGLTYHGTKIIKDNNTVIYEGKDYGLTCSTFIMAVFKGLDQDLININEWDEREEDKDVHKKLVQILKEKGVQNIEKLENDIGCARFRPEEVTAASSFEDIPASTLEIRQRGKELKDEIIQKTSK